MSGVGTEADTQVRPTETEMYLGGKKVQGKKPKILWIQPEKQDPPDREDTEIRISKAPYGFYLEVIGKEKKEESSTEEGKKPRRKPRITRIIRAVEGEATPPAEETRLYLEAFVGLHSGRTAYLRAEQIREYGLVVV